MTWRQRRRSVRAIRVHEDGRVTLAADTDAGRLVLRDASGRPVPFQFQDAA